VFWIDQRVNPSGKSHWKMINAGSNGYPQALWAGYFARKCAGMGVVIPYAIN